MDYRLIIDIKSNYNYDTKNCFNKEEILYIVFIEILFLI